MNADFNVYTEDGKALLPLHEQAPIHLTRKLSLTSDGVSKGRINTSAALEFSVALNKGELFAAIANNGKSSDLMVAFHSTQSDDHFIFYLLNANALDYNGDPTQEFTITQTVIDALEIYIFGTDDIKALQSGAGLEVYSEEGKVLFSSNNPPMNALGRYDGNYERKYELPQGKTETFSFGGREKIAVVCTCGIRVLDYVMPPPHIYETRSVAKFTAANKVTLTEAEFCVGYFPNPGSYTKIGPFFISRAWRFLLIDASSF